MIEQQDVEMSPAELLLVEKKFAEQKIADAQLKVEFADVVQRVALGYHRQQEARASVRNAAAILIDAVIDNVIGICREKEALAILDACRKRVMARMKS